MAKRAAGIVLYRRAEGGIQVLLGHLGGPYNRKKDNGAWTVPKGLVEPGENDEQAARREWLEETGFSVPAGELRPLPEFKQYAGKTARLFLLEGDVATDRLKSNTFRLQWPPRSGKYEEFPELDRFAWFTLAEAEQKLSRGLVPLTELIRRELQII